ncbi:hypothetical protein NM208_g1383 [Fusarium decemcellulare]|uniref:Uncharacterized protein n=1 Tax=Fusarium decemcellulare TaxID=57161 RepID=A0ACC1SWC4_9HYPO|nr:hypothetical protein NM208_g1383 [Fusarium decemcellulare]
MVYVDVLVLNAATFGDTQPILQSGTSSVWADYEHNVRSTLDMTHRFYHQNQSGGPKQKFLINVSSAAAYMWSTMNPQKPTYGLTKNAALVLLQQIAKDTEVNDMQVVSFHPGGILTEPGRKHGLREGMGFMFDDEDLPGRMAVWSASTEAKFLHGRFVWSNWDMDEIKNGPVGRQILEDENFLKVGVEGLTEKWAGSTMDWYGLLPPSLVLEGGETETSK